MTRVEIDGIQEADAAAGNPATILARLVVMHPSASADDVPISVRAIRIPREQADIVDHADQITFFFANGAQAAFGPDVDGFAEVAQMVVL